jgi:hypothetical protein
MDFSPNPEGDASIASNIRNTFEITPTATAFWPPKRYDSATSFNYTTMALGFNS